ncbi:hypothetical protein MNV49_004860 [Pseudohyphozyma bogoriensis]|nr:hypothetical protein MNV49_004860 [Pseudohyphozyma bogoriensis]
MAHAEAFLAETLTSLTHPITDFSVSVTLSGTPTAIYAPQTDAMKRKLSGFVESKAGEGFHVNVLDNRRNPEFAVLLRLYLDGKFMGHLETPTHGRRWSTPANDASRVQSFTGKRDSESTRKPFTFHPLFAAESDDEEWRPPPPEGFGTIRITVHRITDLQRVPREGNDGFKGFRGHDDDEAARKAGGGGKKAMMRHRTGFGDSQPAPRGGGSVPMKTTYKFYDRDDSPWWTFELRYLDRRAPSLRIYVRY